MDTFLRSSTWCVELLDMHFIVLPFTETPVKHSYNLLFLQDQSSQVKLSCSKADLL
jgi:hypothetical protein